jgi:hypothetical protein
VRFAFCLPLLSAFRLAVDQVGREHVVPAPIDHRLQFCSHGEADPGGVCRLRGFLLHHVEVAVPDIVEPHREDVRASLGGEQRQVDRVLQPRRRVCADGAQAFDGVALACFLLHRLDCARGWLFGHRPLAAACVKISTSSARAWFAARGVSPSRNSTIMRMVMRYTGWSPGRLVSAVEVYSIDEFFADLSGIADPEALRRQVRREVLRRTGIPVGVGIGSTKTLAKLANHAAKRWQRQTGGVVDICDPERRDKLLRAIEVSEVWGIGRRMTEHLQGMGIKTAWDLAAADAWTLRKQFSVVVEKTARELRGTPCLDLEEEAPPKQEICCSRMFGKRLRELPPIREAVATYAALACEKLRAQGSVCERVRASIRPGMFNSGSLRLVKQTMPTGHRFLAVGIAQLITDGQIATIARL